MSANRRTTLNRINHHCTVVVLDGMGVMIEGRSGDGKTSLAHGLVESFRNERKTACFVGDDQVLLTGAHSSDNNRLVANAPEQTGGKAELYGYGIINVDWVEKAGVDLLVLLVPDKEIDRMPDTFSEMRCGIDIPSIRVPVRHEAQAIRIVKAKMREIRQQ